MEMTDLEDVARRYKEATDALDAVRTEMQTTAVAVMQQPGVKQADVARVTGWSREHLRRLREKAESERQKAEMEALRQRVEELSAAATPPANKKEPSAAVAAPRRQVTQTVPETPAPQPVSLSTPEAKQLVKLAHARANAEQAQRLYLTAKTAKSLDQDQGLKALDAAYEMGLLTDPDVLAVREQLAAEPPRPAVDATKEN